VFGDTGEVLPPGLKTVEANPDAKRLYDDLLSNYNRLIRPVGNNSETLTVWLGLKLSQLIEVVGSDAPTLRSRDDLYIYYIFIYFYYIFTSLYVPPLRPRDKSGRSIPLLESLQI
jgi:Neurotransmitter-gated ion-channel ligand binding domain